jgi:hypothetical protein
VDSNKTRKTSPNGYGQASSWRRLPTIDTDQYVALVVGNNILKFHQDRTTNEPPISDGSGYEKNSIFSLFLSGELSLPCFFFFFFLFFLLFFSAATCCPSSFLSFLSCSFTAHVQEKSLTSPFLFSFFQIVGPSHRREHPPNKSPPPDYVGGSTNPAAILQISSFCIGNDFVIISEPLSSVWIFSICINFSSSASRIQ